METGPTSSSPFPKTEPSYLNLFRLGELAKRSETAREMLLDCRLCPRECRVNRLAGQKGFCRGGEQPQVAAYNSHPGEEPPVSGTRGSGTIFFSNCNLACKYCQNFPISQLGVGREVTSAELAGMFLKLQKRGCHNINFVTPTHFAPQIVLALKLAVEEGFRLPLVYNTNGYDSLATLSLLKDIVDIYLPDMKYADYLTSKAFSGVSDYPRHNRRAVKEMFRQVGFLQTDELGMARRGLIIRHLLLPEGKAESAAIFAFIHSRLSPRLHLSFMSQYFPAHLAHSHSILHRRVSEDETEAAWKALLQWRLDEGWFQDCEEEDYQNFMNRVSNF